MSINTKFSPEIPVETLFHFADIDGDGMIGGSDALFFFQYTKLAMNTLSKIWSLSVPPKKPMFLAEFTKALVLIYYAQQNQPISNELFSKPPPYSPPIIDIPFFMSEEQIKQADTLFNQLIDTDHVTVTKEIFADKVLTQFPGVLTMEDIMKIVCKPEINELNRNEFLLALALLKNQKGGFPLPKAVPSYFFKYVSQFEYHPQLKQNPIQDVEISQPTKNTSGSPVVEKPVVQENAAFPKEDDGIKPPTKAVPPLPRKNVIKEEQTSTEHSSEDKKEEEKKEEEKKEELKTSKSAKELKEEKKRQQREEEKRKKEEKKKAEELKKEEERKKREEKKELEKLKREEKKHKKVVKQEDESDSIESGKSVEKEVKENQIEQLVEEKKVEQDLFSFEQPIENKIPTSILRDKKGGEKKETFSFGDSFSFGDEKEVKESSELKSQKTQPLEFNFDEPTEKEQEANKKETSDFDGFSFDAPVVVSKIPTSVVKSRNSNSFSFGDSPKENQIDTEGLTKELEEIKTEEYQINEGVNAKLGQIEQLQNEIRELETKKQELSKRKKELEDRLADKKSETRQELKESSKGQSKEELKESSHEELGNSGSKNSEDDSKMMFGKSFNKTKYGFKGNAFNFPIQNEQPTLPFSSMFEGII